ALACIPVLACLLACGIAAGVRRAVVPTPAAASWQSGWLQREAALRMRLRADPQNDAARLQLAVVLLNEAPPRAGLPQNGRPLPEVPDRAYTSHLAGQLPASPAFREARQLAASVARHGRDGPERGRAWYQLSLMSYYSDEAQGRLACLKAAAR